MKPKRETKESLDVVTERAKRKIRARVGRLKERVADLDKALERAENTTRP